MNINKMTKKDFLSLPRRNWNEEIGAFDSIVVIPLPKKHDSGYRVLDFAAVRDNEATCLLSGCSDVLNLGGIGGLKSKRNWNIDCLPKSGLLRIFSEGKIEAGMAISSFEIF